MQSTDPKLVTFPGTTPPVRRGRDPRIDAFRGLALLMIFVDHVPGNPYEYWTIRNFGFSDAAEAFFVMSGIAAALAYAGRFAPEERARAGLWPAVAPMWKRAWTLYLVHILLTVWAIAIFTFAADVLGQAQFLDKNNMGLVVGHDNVFIGIALLTHQLGYVNILPAYSVLLLVGPLAILIGMWRPWLLAALSAAIWLSAGVWRLDLPNYPQPGGWFFNPVAWQAVFMAGLLIGLAMRKGERLVPKSPWIFALAAGFLIFAYIWRHVPVVGDFMDHQLWRLGRAGFPFNTISHDKTYLAMPRLLHILSLVYVLSCLDIVYRAADHRLAAPLRLLGRQGLLVFAVGTVLSLAFQVVFALTEGLAWVPWLLPLVGVVVMLVFAWAADGKARARRRLPEVPAAEALSTGAAGEARRARKL